jgi:hypothetical protein
MQLKNYEEIRITVLEIASEDMIRTSGEEFGISWDKDKWGNGGF